MTRKQQRNDGKNHYYILKFGKYLAPRKRGIFFPGLAPEQVLSLKVDSLKMRIIMILIDTIIRECARLCISVSISISMNK